MVLFVSGSEKAHGSYRFSTSTVMSTVINTPPPLSPSVKRFVLSLKLDLFKVDFLLTVTTESIVANSAGLFPLLS